ENVDCRGPVARCTIAVVAPGHPNEQGIAPIVFDVTAAPPAVVTVAAIGVRSGDRVRVSGRGFPPGATGQVAQCVPSATLEGRSCVAPKPAVDITFDQRGEGAVDYRVRADDRCRRGRQCRITVD